MSEGTMLGLRKKGKQITDQSISLTITVEVNMEGDNATGKMATTTSEGNMHETENKQTQITFYGNKSLTCSI